MFTISQVNKELPVSELTGQERVVLFNRRDVLLSTANGVNSLPLADDVRGLLSADGMLMAVGTIDGAICCGTSAQLEDVDIPAGLSVKPTRIAFAESGPDIMNAVSRVREMSTWRRQHRLCGGCGTPMSFSDTDLALVCPQCGERYYPQIAPAVIVAITRNGRKELLLAHNKRFTDRTFGLIAGFVETGETVEQAVRRECWRSRRNGNPAKRSRTERNWLKSDGLQEKHCRRFPRPEVLRIKSSRSFSIYKATILRRASCRNRKSISRTCAPRPSVKA